MKIIDAFWEERNLGVTCYELEPGLADSLEEVAAELDGLAERQYMVAKIPSARYDLVRLFQDKGYSFIETAIKLEFNYKKLGYKPPEFPNRLQKIYDKCSWAVMDESDLAQLSAEINKNMFHTDRIFADPAFTKEQAARSYNLWIKYIIDQGYIPRKVVFEHKTIGFFSDKVIAPKVCQGILGGIYKDSQKPGIGFVRYYAEFMSRVEDGIEKAIYSASGNNPAALQLSTLFGAEIRGLTYVFVKHVNQNLYSQP